MPSTRQSDTPKRARWRVWGETLIPGAPSETSFTNMRRDCLGVAAHRIRKCSGPISAHTQPRRALLESSIDIDGPSSSNHNWENSNDVSWTSDPLVTRRLP